MAICPYFCRDCAPTYPMRKPQVRFHAYRATTKSLVSCYRQTLATASKKLDYVDLAPGLDVTDFFQTWSVIRDFQKSISNVIRNPWSRAAQNRVICVMRDTWSVIFKNWLNQAGLKQNYPSYTANKQIIARRFKIHLFQQIQTKL